MAGVISRGNYEKSKKHKKNPKQTKQKTKQNNAKNKKTNTNIARAFMLRPAAFMFFIFSLF